MKQQIQELVKATLIIGAKRGGTGFPTTEQIEPLIEQHIEGLVERFLKLLPETVTCECDAVVPIKYATSMDEGWACPNCVKDMAEEKLSTLTQELSQKDKKIESLFAEKQNQADTIRAYHDVFNNHFEGAAHSEDLDFNICQIKKRLKEERQYSKNMESQLSEARSVYEALKGTAQRVGEGDAKIIDELRAELSEVKAERDGAKREAPLIHGEHDRPFVCWKTVREKLIELRVIAPPTSPDTTEL